MKSEFSIIVKVVLVVVFVMQVQGQERIERTRIRARSIEPIISSAAARYGVDPHLLWTIGYLESGFNSSAISYKDGVPCAFGLMQFVPSTAKRYGLRNPHEPREALDTAARYVRDLMARFDGNLDLVLAAYNAGEGAVEAYRYGRRLMLPNGKVVNPRGIRTGGIPPYTETRDEWTKPDGSRTVFNHGTKPQNAQPLQSNTKVTPFDIWRLDLSARTFSSLIVQVETVAIEEHPSIYVLNFLKSGMVEPGGIARASLVISRADMHVTELTVVARDDSQMANINPQFSEYRFVEASFERRAPNTVAPAVFEVEPDLITDVGRLRRVRPRVLNVPAQPFAAPPIIATADLEVEVMRLLSDAKADLGEQISVSRTPEGLLRIQGVVETDKRKREILSVLDPVVSNPAVRVDIRTVTEALAEQRRESPRNSATPTPISVEQMQTAGDTFPAYSDLRRLFSEEESRTFADRMVERSRRAMSHAGAMKKLTGRFSPEELRTLTPEARVKWLTVIRNHARAFEQEARMLRRELEPIFFPAAPATEGHIDVLLGEDQDVIRAVDRLFELGLANERVVRAAFAVSSERATNSEFRSQSFWKSLREAEALAAKFANRQ